MSKSFAFTINNFTEEDKQNVERLKDLTNVLYAAFEKGQSGTPHIQGFATFKKSKKCSGVSKLIPRAHIEIAKGRKDHNYKYIIQGINADGTRKEHSTVFIEHDTGTPGARTDLATFIDTARTKGIKRAAEEYPVSYVRNYKGVKALLIELAQPRTTAPTSYWLYGPTGIGKTFFAFQHSNKVYFADHAPNWYDGFNDHDWVIYDEVDKRQLPLGHILRVADEYAFMPQVKHGHVNFTAPYVVFTSTCSPFDMFPNEDDQAQLYRRINFIGTKNKKEDDWTWIKCPTEENENTHHEQEHAPEHSHEGQQQEQ